MSKHDDEILNFDNPRGLTTKEHEVALEKHGYNEVIADEPPVWQQILSRFLGIVPLFITTTAVLSAVIESECDLDLDPSCTDLRDWASFVLLIVELLIVVYADYTGSKSSGDAIKQLQEASASKMSVKRDGSWVPVPTRELVPGDLVAITIGATIPADGVICSPGEPLKLDYSSLTGEPLPEKKGLGDTVLSGAVVLVGEGDLLVTRTGKDSSLGTTQALIAEAKKEKETGGELSSTLNKVVVFLTGFGVLVAVYVAAKSSQDFNLNAGEAIKQAFVLLSTILPVTMPLILTTTLAVGAQELASDDAVVQRFSAIPEMAQMDILCSDKTGTLTLGEMTVIRDESVVFHDDLTVDDMLELALVASRIEHSDPIDAAITKYFKEPAKVLDQYDVSKFVPFDPVTKRVTAVATKKSNNEKLVIVKGAPPVLMGFSGISSELFDTANKALTDKSERGFKTLAVCVEIDENEWKLLGLISILDPPRSDTADTVAKCSHLGVEVKMITGDQRLIAVEVARQLGLPNLAIFEKDVFNNNSSVVNQAGGFGPLCEKAGGFAGVSPEHKHRVVTSLQGRGHFVGMTGDGVNDAPALSIANVGIAVAGATDAARGASDIVLQQEGLSTIVKALYGSRKIFKRIETYLTYRLASSFIFGFALSLIYTASRYNFPTWTLILLSLLNDFAVSSSSKDQVIIQRNPVSLNIWRVATTSFVMAIVSSLEVWGMVESLKNYDGSNHFWGLEPTTAGFDQFTGCEIAAVVFLNLIITVQFNLLVARTPKPFFVFNLEKDEAGHFTGVPPPSVYVLGSIGVSLTIATFIAVYWEDNLIIGSGYGMQGIGWRNAALIWCWAILWFVIIDLCKFVTLTIWDEVEKSKDSRTFFRNIFEFGQDNRSIGEGRVDDLRQTLRKFDEGQELHDASSLRSQGTALALGPLLASIAQEEHEENILTVQDVILSSETLQNDPQLMRVVSQLVYEIAKMQARLNTLEGKEPHEKKLLLKKDE